ncbi:hypothetical protein EUAN_14770 [Andreesenia angusta]|uniref:Uncharacterized protein n=1 Tax=Andreesenia angusta TaxID=39480 RepID=A0A1S1V8F7_9FIRM|nr:hypothetical protein [Andreesenia angusta]OHW62029.1 hypothetical protein EUAN_14770 [Andreesenia angusta]
MNPLGVIFDLIFKGVEKVTMKSWFKLGSILSLIIAVGVFLARNILFQSNGTFVLVMLMASASSIALSVLTHNTKFIKIMIFTSVIVILSIPLIMTFIRQ